VSPCMPNRLNNQPPITAPTIPRGDVEEEPFVKPREVAARPRKAGHESVGYRIFPEAEHDRDGLGRLLGRAGRSRPVCQDEIDLEPHQFSREGPEPVSSVRAPPLELEILTLARGNGIDAHSLQVNDQFGQELVFTARVSRLNIARSRNP